jgi:signal peptidase II
VDPSQRRTVTLVALVTLVVDLGTKWWAETALADAPVDLGFITLRLAQNPGVAFSLGADAPSWIVTAVTATAVVLIAAMAWRGTLRPPLAAGLLLGGGLGNLLDRLAGGTVTDFFDLGWFPSFNVADIALNVGVGLVLLVGLFHRDEHGRTDGEADGHHGTGTHDDPAADRA